MYETSIVAFLQNQWWKDPKRVQEYTDKQPDPEKYRRRLLVYGLSQCRSGKMLERTIPPWIGAPAFKSIYWENVSREFGGHSGCKFKADPDHIRKVVDEQRPRIILCFGKVASDAVRGLIVGEDLHILYADHPAARRGTASLEKLAKDLKELLEQEKEDG